jgi:hypothetical protein
MANQNRRLKRGIKAAIKKDAPVPKPRAGVSDVSDLRARRTQVRQELVRLGKLESHTRYQHKQLLRFESELEKLDDVIGKK